MHDREPNDVTRLLRDWRAGDRQALDRLLPLVHDELRRIAGRRLRGERADHTLQTTALVNEAYLKLVDMDVGWEDRVHFFAIAASAMRRILVDHAKARLRLKRGGDREHVPLDDVLVASPGRGEDIVALDEALVDLAALDERKSRIVELHYFGGLTYDEITGVLGVSAATVDRDLRMAKAWLRDRMTSGGEDEGQGST